MNKLLRDKQLFSASGMENRGQATLSTRRGTVNADKNLVAAWKKGDRQPFSANAGVWKHDRSGAEKGVSPHFSREANPRISVGIELLIDTLRHAGEVRLRAQGLSMVPALWPGEVLVVARKGFPDVTVGEIAVFRCHGGIAAHRVLKTQGTGLDTIVTRGDAMTVDDAPVSADEFLGVVVEVERGGRRVVPSAYRTPAARMASAVFARSAHVSRWAQKIMANGH